MIFLGVAAARRLRDPVLLAEIVTKTLTWDVSAYPRWLVVLVGTLVAALVIWIAIKLLKLALWILFFAVLIGGTFYSIWLLVNAGSP